MKKLFFALTILLCLAGCGKYNEKDAINDFSDKISNCKGYYITGTLELWKDETKYTYDVESSYKKKDMFKVSLVNKTNNHEQIILKNNDGIFVLTPSLNKSFKFQSEWPYNNSQVYLLQPLLNDIKNDSNKKFESKNDQYIFTTSVEYANDKDLTKQKIYFDKDMNLIKVDVMDKNNNVQIKFTVGEIDFKAKFDDNYFKVDNNITVPESEDENESSEQTTASIEENLYPMYVPTDTYLANQDKVSTDEGERLIMTFSGESPFIIVQDATKNTELTVDYVYGDPYMILDTVGAVTDYSVAWNSNGVEYYVASDVMSQEELITVAESINLQSVGK